MKKKLISFLMIFIMFLNASNMVFASDLDFEQNYGGMPTTEAVKQYLEDTKQSYKEMDEEMKGQNSLGNSSNSGSNKSLSSSSKTYTTSKTSLSWDSIWQTGQDWEKEGSKNQKINDSTIIDTIVPVGQMLTAVGIAVLFGCIIILGIKYMTKGPEEKGKLKGQLIGLVISGVVIFGAYTIWKIAYNFMNDLF